MNTRTAFLGSARLQRAGERGLAIAKLLVVFNPRCVAIQNETVFRRAAETNERAACAPENR
jgi:hypothetical protein